MLWLKIKKLDRKRKKKVHELTKKEKGEQFKIDHKDLYINVKFCLNSFIWINIKRQWTMLLNIRRFHFIIIIFMCFNINCSGNSALLMYIMYRSWKVIFNVRKSTLIFTKCLIQQEWPGVHLICLVAEHVRLLKSSHKEALKKPLLCEKFTRTTSNHIHVIHFAVSVVLETF